ncbi:MAG: DNA replication/repair protein RecF [Natronospirillum sp.]
MQLKRFKVSEFRNIQAATLHPGPAFNLIVGDNGSGKSSLLEAIYLLGTGKSFRVTNNRSLLRVGAERLALYGEVAPAGATIGQERTAAGATHIVVNGDRIHSASQLASLLPVQQITLHDFQLFEGGPKVRRRFLDWGVFHLDHSGSGGLFKRFERAIKQRNSGLKSGKMSRSEHHAWAQEFVKASEALDAVRQRYVELLMVDYRALCAASPVLGFGDDLVIQYVPGWDQKQSLLEALDRPNVRERERRTGITQLGPHRADLKMTWRGLPARDMLSRGQMKVLGHGLKLAQIRCLTRAKDRPLPVILLDDIAAELDQQHLAELLKLVQGFETQVFITALEKGQLPPAEQWAGAEDIQVFHVEQGEVTQYSLQE